MKRVVWLLTFGLLICLMPVGAVGPDDRFLGIYTLIQQGDDLMAASRPGDRARTLSRGPQPSPRV
ncbi:MAG: hypothetical protein M5U12_02245 [Verrucomicrobia bacterium]|nr:hypothetical protein [Verrucomicrobiota bacterium]